MIEKKKYSNAIYEGSIINNQPNGPGTMTFHNGAVYTGQLINGKMMGVGKATYGNGDEYLGTFIKGGIYGDGMINYKNGDFYRGFLMNNTKTGKGSMRYANKNYYNGYFLNGLYHFDGYYVDASKKSEYSGYFYKGQQQYYGNYQCERYTYQGHYQNGYIHGFGKIKYANGDVYEGYFKDGLRHGYGIYTWNNGVKHIGTNENNKRHGYGVYKFTNGSVFKGQIKEDKREGNGIFYYDDGIVFYGNWKDDVRENYGKLVYPNNEYYEGELNGKLRHGKGTFHSSDGVYSGVFENDVLKEGQYKKGSTIYNGTFNEDDFEGEIIYSHIRKGYGKMKSLLPHGYFRYETPFYMYEGEFENGKAIKEGVFTYFNGYQCQGFLSNSTPMFLGAVKSITYNITVFKDGTSGLIQDGPSGMHRIEYKNGAIYEGQLVNDQREGFGTLYFNDEIVFVGDWKDDMFALGRLNYFNEAMVDASFINNVQIGHVKIKYIDGSVYEGKANDFIKQGDGILETKTSTYEGSWEKNQFVNGKHYSKTFKTIGTYKNGMLHGKDIETKKADGSYIKADYENGDINGNAYVKMSNGDIYEGQMRNGSYHGKGTYRFSNGNYYSGDWFYGKREGRIHESRIDGSKYWGNAVDNNYCGEGNISYKDGKYIDGLFFLGEMVWGKYYISEDENYYGHFVDGKRNGFGIYTIQGKSFKGVWDNAKIIFGSFETPNETTYFDKTTTPYPTSTYFANGHQRYLLDEDGEVNGKGVLILENQIYVGDLIDMQMTGAGVLYHPYCYYEGTFQNASLNGKGIYGDVKGYLLDGEFSNGEIVRAKEVLENGEVYEGDFKDNLRHGLGTFTYTNGDRYEGYFVEGLKEGYGIYHFANGNRYEGPFKEGLPNGLGKQYFTNGDMFIGDFVEGKRHGFGTYYQDGVAVKYGFWENDEYKAFI